MATLLTDLKAALTNPKDRLGGAATRGRVNHTTATYSVAAAMADTDTIEIMDLPVGAIVLPEYSSVITDGVGSSTCTLNIGDAGDADRYATALDMTSAGKVDFDAFPIADYEVVEANKTLVATVSLTGAAAGTETLKFSIGWKHGNPG